MKQYTKYLIASLTILFTLFLTESKAQGCVLSDEECRKVLVLKNERDSFLEQLKISQQLVDTLQAQVQIQDSTIKSYVVIEKRYTETVEINDALLEQKEKDIVKLSKKIRLQRIVIRVGVPIGFGLGLVAGGYAVGLLP